ncbi:MAG: ABC transporter substrate-binding protein [Bacillota bacterium]|nr:ABC transporter substrate-binding protein [Bacillota bacterium]
MMKKVLALAVTTMVASMTLAGCGNSASNSSEIKIGAVLPLTGDVSAMGQSCKNAIQMAASEVNDKGGINGKKVTFVFEDDENKPPNAANVTQKLIDEEKVVGIVGSYSSKCDISMGPIATQNKIPMVGLGTNPKVTVDGGEYVFRASFNDTFQGTTLAKVATEDLHAKTAAMLYDVGNDYCKGLSQYFKENFEKLGGKVIASETYNVGEQDFNAQLTKIKGLNPDVILLPDYYNTVGVIAKQARALGIKATLIGGDGWDSPDLFKIAGDAVNGSYFSNFFSADDTSPEVVAYRKAYEAKYKEVPDAISGMAYNAAKIMMNAIQKAGSTDGDKIQKALQDTDYVGVAGRIKYDKNRDAVMSAVVVKIEDQKQKFVRKVNP